MDLKSLALAVPDILLPAPDVDMTKWAVVACDQYTSQVGIWHEIEGFVGDNPSTLKIIFPEVYLEAGGRDERIRKINSEMLRYLNEGTLVPRFKCLVLVDRKTSAKQSRKGLIVSLDLENYDYSPDSKTMIRSTEGTVIDRLPPRIKIRENAQIESPHIMVLIDDPGRTVIEPLFKMSLEKIYDFDLMMNSGHLKGWAINDEHHFNQIASALAALADSDNYRKRYGHEDGSIMLYAMGDGNHSLATAKSIWEKMKNEAADRNAIMEHPARYALVELVNIHDEGLEFEPIHRVLFNMDMAELLSDFKAFTASEGSSFSVIPASSPESLNKKPSSRSDVHLIPFLSGSACGTLRIENPGRQLEYATLQTFLDEYLKLNPSTRIDYVHGESIVAELGSKQGNMGFFLPVIPKETFFRTIIIDGVLPRKSFSMGHADEKRFYLECRKIK